MTKEDFDRILKEEGIDNQALIDAFWQARPTDEIDERRLRKATKVFTLRENGKN
jgi:hypothetical protein